MTVCTGSGDVSGHQRRRPEAAIHCGDMRAVLRAMVDRGDSGTAARFFYCAKASRHDRDEGCEMLDERPLLWSAGTQNPGSFQSEGTRKVARNHHPTVKPTALMRWLVRLVSPPGTTVLDPFCGSGSTGKACAIERRDFVGIEWESDYARIAQARIARVPNTTVHRIDWTTDHDALARATP